MYFFRISTVASGVIHVKCIARRTRICRTAPVCAGFSRWVPDGWARCRELPFHSSPAFTVKNRGVFRSAPPVPCRNAPKTGLSSLIMPNASVAGNAYMPAPGESPSGIPRPVRSSNATCVKIGLIKGFYLRVSPNALQGVYTWTRRRICRKSDADNMKRSCPSILRVRNNQTSPRSVCG